MSGDDQAPSETRTVVALLRWRAEQTPDALAYSERAPDGSLVKTSWREHWQQVVHIGRGLSALGVQSGDRVGIAAGCCHRWEISHLAVLSLGATVVGIDAHDIPSRRSAAARRADVSVFLAETPRLLVELEADVRERLHLAVLFDGAAAGARSWAELVEAGDRLQGALPCAVPLPRDIATVIFTSGTTGEPKQLSYRHDQLMLAVRSMLDTFPRVGVSGRTVCWLPLSNLFQRITNLVAMAQGASTHLVGSPADLPEALCRVRPHVLIGVPRFFEKLHDEIVDRIGRRPRWQRALLQLGLTIGARRSRALAEQRGLAALGWKAPHWVADQLLLRRLRSFTGGRLRCFISGSAPMPQWLLESFHAMGLLVLEAYGVSENVLPIAANRLDAYRFGTVGKALPGNRLRIAADGELWVAGPGLSACPSLDERQPWHRTGDFATIDADGFVRLVGRKAEVFKLSTGRKVAPAPIEAAIGRLAYVDHALVLGEGCKRPLALLTLDARAPVDGDGQPDSARIVADVQGACRGLPPAEQPAACLISTERLSLEAGALTANAKLKRKTVLSRFAADIEQLKRQVNAAESPHW